MEHVQMASDTICNPIWQVTLCSAVMGFLLKAVPFNTLSNSMTTTDNSISSSYLNIVIWWRWAECQPCSQLQFAVATNITHQIINLPLLLNNTFLFSVKVRHNY